MHGFGKAGGIYKRLAALLACLLAGLVLIIVRGAAAIRLMLHRLAHPGRSRLPAP